MTIRVLVTDDQAPFRRAARSVLSTTADFELVGEATSGEEAVALVGSLHPHIVLMDIEMRGIGGVEATRLISATNSAPIMILLSTCREDDLPPQARTCGAVAYLHKSDFEARVLRELWNQHSSAVAR